MKTGIITLFRGDKALADRWSASVAKMAPSGIPIIAVVPSDSGIEIADHGATEIRVEPFFSKAKPGTFEYSADRCDYIAGLYNQAIRKLAGTDQILLFEDDITPPTDGLDRLQRALSIAGERVAGMVSVYPIRQEQKKAMLAIEEWGLAPDIAEVPKSVFPVFSGGTGFSLWRTRQLIASLPIRRLEASVDWDSALSLDLRKRGMEIHCDGGTRCSHA